MDLTKFTDLASLNLASPPKRVVSLVPSMTETWFDLGLGDTLVGVTDYCIHPADGVRRLPRVGGPKTIKPEVIRELGPDLILANCEENSLPGIEALHQLGLPVWLSFPKTVQDTITMLWQIVDLYRDLEAEKRVRVLEQALVWCQDALSEQTSFRYFCPIWQGEWGEGMWWMTFNQDTYPASLLSVFGGENVFADRERRYPLEADLGEQPAEPTAGRDVRYPRVSLAEIVAASPDVILLPSEPYEYTVQHTRQFVHWFADTPAGRARRVVWLDGTLLMWPGTRLGKALAEIPALLLSN